MTAVRSELVSESRNSPASWGKYREIHQFCLPTSEFSIESVIRINALQSEFPTRSNREIIAPEQGIKSADQGSFSSDQGRSSGSDRPRSAEYQRFDIAVGAHRGGSARFSKKDEPACCSADRWEFGTRSKARIGSLARRNPAPRNASAIASPLMDPRLLRALPSRRVGSVSPIPVRRISARAVAGRASSVS